MSSVNLTEEEQIEKGVSGEENPSEPAADEIPEPIEPQPTNNHESVLEVFSDPTSNATGRPHKCGALSKHVVLQTGGYYELSICHVNVTKKKVECCFTYYFVLTDYT